MGWPVAKRSRTSHLNRWRQSAEFRQIATRALKTNLVASKAAPRCGARRKRDGAPCCRPAMKNGRCYLHGGKTPSGRQWHVVQFPDCSTPAGEAKFNRKLRDRERIARKRAAWIAAMTPERRAKYDAWHRTHAPGAKAARKTERERRRQSVRARLLLNGGASRATSDPKLVLIEATLVELRAELARLEAQDRSLKDADGGVFA